MTDSSMNNMVHLPGRLAPSYVLSHTTGAPLQLQRELQWREVLDKRNDSSEPAGVSIMEYEAKILLALYRKLDLDPYPNFDKLYDANSYWMVRPVPETSAKQGDGIKSGSIIRLKHMKTIKWLHSHLHASPILGNLEMHSRKMNVHPHVNFEVLARSTDDLNGAQLKAVCVEAYMCKKSMMRLTLKKNKADNLHQLIGVATPVVDVNNPSVGTPKGRRKLRIKGGNEKSIEKRFEEQECMFIM
ncbi:stromal cell-derived factor 2-like protein [Tanacetum coccineum]